MSQQSLYVFGWSKEDGVVEIQHMIEIVDFHRRFGRGAQKTRPSPRVTIGLMSQEVALGPTNVSRKYRKETIVDCVLNENTLATD